MAQPNVGIRLQTLSTGAVYADLGVAGLHIEEVGAGHLEVIYNMNQAIFGEERIINSFKRKDLLMLLAYVDDVPAGFKIGYAQNKRVYYSAKGGVLPDFRRRGIARAMLYLMIDIVHKRGYERFMYDTFPNRHPGMVIMGLQEGFEIIRADYNPTYKDYRLRLAKTLIEGAS